MAVAFRFLNDVDRILIEPIVAKLRLNLKYVQSIAKKKRIFKSTQCLYLPNFTDDSVVKHP